MEEIRLDYDDRKSIIFEIQDTHQRGMLRNKVRCSCKRMFLIEGMFEKDITCPHCGHIITKENSVYLKFGRYKAFNSTSMMYLNDDSLVISLPMLTLSRTNFNHHLNIGNDFFRLKVKYNISTRTSLAYTDRLRTEKWAWDKFKLPTKYLNFTQPINNTIDTHKYDITLPSGLIEDFFTVLGLEAPKNQNVTLEDLAWVNRLRKPFEECMREKYILSLIVDKKKRLEEAYTQTNINLRSAINTKDVPIDNPGDIFFDPRPYDEKEHKKYVEELTRKVGAYKERLEYHKKTEGRIKRYLKTDYKPKDYDRNIFDALLESLNIDKKYIPKDLERYYYQYPQAIIFADVQDELYTNRDVRINAIKSTMINYENYRIYSLDYVEKDILRSNIIKAFATEVNIQKKLQGNDNYEVLRDTAKMINEIRNIEKTKPIENRSKIITKGSIFKVHNSVQEIYNTITLPKITFDLTKDKEDVIYNLKGKEYTFTFEKTPQDLMKIHYDLNICVGSYWEYCKNNSIMIVSIKEDSKYIGCLELRINYDGTIKLVQAKGDSNTALKSNIQKLVSEFCNDINCKIGTKDIKKANIQLAA